MRQKAGAALIVVAIGGVTVSVLYSPARISGPAVHRDSSARVIVVKQPSVADVPVASKPPVASRTHPQPGSFVEPPPSAVGLVGLPRQAETAPVPEAPTVTITARSIVAAAPLAVGAHGSLRAERPSHRRPLGAMRAAGQSVGTAFAVAGRGIRSAFRLAF